MKMKHLLNLPTRRGNANVFSLFVALMLLATSVSAQIQPDKLRMVPTVEGDASSEFLIATHLTDTLCGHNSFDPATHCLDVGTDPAKPAGIQVTQGGDYFEYQIMSPIGGEFAAVLGLASEAPDALANVSVYKVDEEFEMNGTTMSTYNGAWHSLTEFTFPFSLEAGEVYVMRLTWSNSGSNIFTINVKDISGPTDSSLKDIQVNGVSIEGFDPEVMSYSVPLKVNEGYEQIEAMPTDETATVTYGDATVVGHSTKVPITVTSLSGISSEYIVTVFEPIVVEDGGSLLMADDMFVNNGFSATNSKMNKIANGDYAEYYVYAPQWEGNFTLNILAANGYDPSESFLNVSVLALDDSTWTVKDVYSQRMEISYDGEGNTQWGIDYASEYNFIFSLEADEPVLLRVYAVTDKGNAADVWGMTFSEVTESIDATLSDLKVDGETIDGFDPETNVYKIPLTPGTTSVTTSGTVNDSSAETEGFGEVMIEGFVTSDTILVTSASGFAVPYILNFVSPIEVPNTSDNDTLKLALTADLYESYDVRITNPVQLNWWANDGYVEYYIYSEVDKDVFLRAKVTNAFNVVNGTDTVYANINVTSFTPDMKSDWVLDTDYSWGVEDCENWEVDYANDMDWNFSLVGGEAKIVRVYGTTNEFNTANVYSISIIEGTSDFIGKDPTIPTSIDKPVFEENASIKVYGGTGNLTVLCDEDYVGGTVQIFDISGNLVKSEVVSSTNKVYSVNQRGLYIVRVISKDNAVKAAKCIVQ